MSGSDADISRPTAVSGLWRRTGLAESTANISANWRRGWLAAAISVRSQALLSKPTIQSCLGWIERSANLDVDFHSAGRPFGVDQRPIDLDA